MEADRTSQIVKLLLHNGSNPSLKDQSGHTAWDVTKDKDSAVIAALLQERMECEPPAVLLLPKPLPTSYQELRAGK
jgi:ankyrin repeat protein